MTRTNQCESLITFQCQEKHWYCEEPEEPEVVLLPVMRSMEISSALSAQIVRNTKTELMSLVHTDLLAWLACLSLHPPGPGFLFVASLAVLRTRLSLHQGRGKTGGHSENQCRTDGATIRRCREMKCPREQQ